MSSTRTMTTRAAAHCSSDSSSSTAYAARTTQGYRNDPYAFTVLPASYADVAVKSCYALYATTSPAATTAAAAATTTAAMVPTADDNTTATTAVANAYAYMNEASERQQQQQQICTLYDGDEQQQQPQDATMLSSGSADACDGDDNCCAGVSETSSECGNSHDSHRATTTTRTTTALDMTTASSSSTTTMTAAATATATTDTTDALATTTATTRALSASGLSVLDTSTCYAPAMPRLTVFRYASVDFRFGSAWFLAPFRTYVGDMVVVEYAGNNHRLHMGLVSCITTNKPHTFYSEDNHDPNYLSDEELSVLPRLLRHARNHDRETKLELRRHDLRALANARSLAAEMNAPVTFLDAEWLLDLSAITFLVHVYGDVNAADCLADELAAQEGAEVVFTYPAANMLPY